MNKFQEKRELMLSLVNAWHSTISRTRSLLGEEVFLGLFQEILCICITKGMVRGKRQALDSAFIKANASMDSLLQQRKEFTIL